jgi:hypothetical protein
MVNYYMESLDSSIIITKEVLSSDKKHIGHADGLDNKNLIVKDGLIRHRYYIIPRESIKDYEDGKVVLKDSQQVIKKRSRRKFPGYFMDLT